MKSLTPWILTMVLFVFAFGCKKDDDISTDPSDILAFSQDSVIFDTVFTTVGSTTRLLKVYNNNDQTVSISNLSVNGGEASNFRVNVDGVPGTLFENVEIAADDSMFIFIDVTVDPTLDGNPFVIEDRLNFLLNGNMQEVLLVAWGQNAIFHYPQNSIGSLGISCLDPDGDCFNEEPPVDANWTSELPHVVYGYIVIDEFDHLTIEEGTQIHFHADAGMWVFQGGQLTVEGTKENKVVFQGDRLDFVYDDVPGQWDRIIINESPAGMDHVIKHAIIKNSTFGIQAKPFAANEDASTNSSISPNKLIMENVIMQDHSATALWATNFRVEAENCLFANAGSYCGLFQGEGQYDINHCTFANYWTENTRTSPGFLISNSYLNEFNGMVQVTKSILTSTLTNNIFYGNDFEEFNYQFDVGVGLTVDVSFDRNLFKVDEADVNNIFFTNSVTNYAPSFVDISTRDFHLAETAIGIQSDNSILNEDLDCVTRDPGAKEKGCYEFVP